MSVLIIIGLDAAKMQHVATAKMWPRLLAAAKNCGKMVAAIVRPHAYGYAAMALYGCSNCIATTWLRQYGYG